MGKSQWTRLYLLVAFFGLSMDLHAVSVFRCIDDEGQTMFSDRPCTEDADQGVVDIRVRDSVPPDESRKQVLEEYLENREKSRERLKAKTERKNRERRERCESFERQLTAAQKKANGFYIRAPSSESYAEGGRRTERIAEERKYWAEEAQKLRPKVRECRRYFGG